MSDFVTSQTLPPSPWTTTDCQMVYNGYEVGLWILFIRKSDSEYEFADQSCSYGRNL